MGATVKEREIFNKNQKMEYIEFEKANADSLLRYFKRLYKMEESIGKDIADMDDSELRQTLSSLGIRREESRRHMLSLLRGYVKWARLYGKTNNKSTIFNLTAEGLSSKNNITTQMIASPKHLESILYYGIPRVDDDYFFMPNRAARDQLVFWLLYSGMTTRELSVLKKQDIDIQNKTVVANKNKKYPVSHTIISLWKECSESMYIERKKGSATGKSSSITKGATKSCSVDSISSVGDIIKMYLVDNKYLFRGIRGKKNDSEENVAFSEHALLNIVSGVNNHYNNATKENIKLSSEKIRYSGIFHRIYQADKNGQEITPEIIAEYFNIDYTKFSGEKLYSTTKKLITDYKDWKLGFGYGIIYKED